MKKTIYIVIIVVALGGAAVMAYMAFFSGGGSSGGGEVVIEESAQVYDILPEGKELDFTNIREFNRDERLYSYPQVTPSEIGQVLGNIIE